MARSVGSFADVPAPDVMTSSQHMLWMLDEFEVLHGGRFPGFITGKPVGMGGSQGRTEATGYGVVFTIREALRQLGMKPRDTRASVQGFGNVAQHAIRLFRQIGGTVTHEKVKILAEGANGPTTPEADAVLQQKGVFVIPDFLANAGGVTCSYFEQVQSNMNYFWEKDEVLGKLDVKMTAAFVAVSELAERRRLPMRDAAYVIAINRVAQACRDRGWV
jgi:glutamate dehydrogenase/leucine dehydrogenase